MSRGALRELADRVGIIAEYTDQTGHEQRRTSDATRVALLAVMGLDASSEAAARRTLEELDARERARLLAPARVVEAGARELGEVLVPGGEDWPGSVNWTIELRSEDGTVRRKQGRANRRRDGRFCFDLPSGIDVGYHSLRLTVGIRGSERAAEQRLIVVPPSCPRADAKLRRQRVYGLTANLYTVRSERNWGVGDLTDLADLVSWCGELGAAFVGINPLHALRNEGGDISPYSPVSRLYRNTLYIDVDAVPELAHSPEAREIMASGAFLRDRERLRRAARLDYHVVAELKRAVLERLHRTFRARAAADPSDKRARGYRAFLEREGELLRHFATFSAIEESLATASGRPASWREWPEELRDPRSDAVARFRDEHAEAVDLHQWLQFEMDCQLAGIAKRAGKSGLPIGLYQDLAIGTSPDGSDVWMFPGLFLDGASVGAPPDPYSAEGQNWGLPPIDPRALLDDRYEYWVRLVRSALRHSGALRMDHVMGLFRQFWIPAGRSGRDGAYVRFPERDLLGILALEATRAGALVVGEDLGTVPEEVPPALEKWGLLSSKVLYFERAKDGSFQPSASYARDSLATANTHDMPTIAGLWSGRDVELRRAVGLIGGREVAQAERERTKEKARLLERLAAEGILDEGYEPEVGELRDAVHAFLRRTASWLVGISLDDIMLEKEPVNVPGVGPEKFPSWTRRLGISLEQLRRQPGVRRALGAERVWIP